MKFSWSGFSKTLGLAAIAGAVQAVNTAGVAPTSSLKALGTTAATGAITAALAYAFRSPFFTGTPAPPPVDPPK